MKETLLSSLKYTLPIILCFIFVGIIRTELFGSFAYYLILIIFLVSINTIVYIFAKIETGSIKTISQFFAIIIVFIFITISLFAYTFDKFADEKRYLINRDGYTVTGFPDAFYFSGVTFLSIGYGDIIPMGGFRILAILEGILGIVVTLTFIAIGASAIYMSEKNLYVSRMKRFEQDLSRFKPSKKHKPYDPF